MTGADVHDPAKEQRDTARALALLSLFFFCPGGGRLSVYGELG